MMAAFLVIFGKELRLEWRTKESVAVMFIFALAVILLFAFAFNAGSASIKLFAPGLLWMVARIHQEVGREADALSTVDAALATSARGKQPISTPRCCT